MIIVPDPELEAALSESAHRQRIPPELLALKILREHFVTPPLLEPRDEWERGLRALAKDCGVSLSNEALSREELYE